MAIRPIEMSEQLRMIRGVEGIIPKGNGVSAPDGSEKPGFFDFLVKQLKETNNLGVEAEHSIKRTLEGEEMNPHSTIIAIQKASISLTLLMGVKQRLERVYQELIRTPI